MSADAQARHAWVPILTGELRSEAMDAVAAIAAELRAQSFDHGPDLAGGAAGAALLFAHVAQSIPGQASGASTKTVELLERAAEALAGGVQGASLFSGFSGVAWVCEYVGRRFLQTPSELNDPIDEALLGFTAVTPWTLSFDLVAGIVGIGVYGLERRSTAAGIGIVRNVVHRLKELAIEDAAGIRWHTAPRLLPPWQRELYPDGYFNLGVAHGMPGVIAFLAEVCALEELAADARPLLDGAMQWLWSCADESDGISRFGTFVLPEQKDAQFRPSRVAWCYGDLGIAVALLVAARAVRQPEWERFALDTALGVAKRETDSAVADACLCHGAAGNAHLFNRLYQATKDERFLAAAQRWIRTTLSMRRQTGSIAGFVSWRPAARSDLPDGWDAAPGFLEGAAGVALALLAASTPVEPGWDRVMLAAVPPVD
jgi:lantibiotic biosynthesis protein